MTLFKLRLTQYHKKITFEEHVGDCERAMQLSWISGNLDVEIGLGMFNGISLSCSC